MQRLLLIALLSLISACETAPPVIDYEFATFAPIEKEVTHPSTLPNLPPLECYPSSTDCRVAGYTRTGDIDALERFKELAKGNTAVAEANAQTLEVFMEREKRVLAAATTVETITKLREEQLAWERTERAKEKWFYRLSLLLIAGAGIAASAN